MTGTVVAAPARPTSDPEPSSLLLPGGPLTYVDEGPREAPVLLAIHGIPGSLRDFRYLAPQLTDRVRFVRVDLPGFGGSAPVDEAVDTLTGRIRILLALADHLGIREFGVLGHSMGGGTAMVLAADHGDRVRYLALVASVALSLHRGLGMSPRGFGLLARSLKAPVLGPLLVKSVRAEYRRRRFPGVEEMDAATIEIQLRAVSAVDFGRLRKAVRAPLPPTLVAFARDDHMVETEIAEELVRALPSARVLAFDEGGHNLQKTRAVELARAIREGLGV